MVREKVPRRSMLALAKSGGARLLRASGVLRLRRTLQRQRVLILTYHGVLPDGTGHTYLSRNFVERRAFEAQMAFLASTFRCLPLSEAVSLLAQGRALPEHAAVVTFDDGYRNNLTEAGPVLKRHSIPGTIFLATGHIGRGVRMIWPERVAWSLLNARIDRVEIDLSDRRWIGALSGANERELASRDLLRRLKRLPPDQYEPIVAQLEELCAAACAPAPVRYAFLDWDEVRRMDEDGTFEFGSHTVNHVMLGPADQGRKRREVFESKAMLDAVLKRPCRLFAYPNGEAQDFDEEDQRNLAEAGYSCAATQIAGLNDHATPRFALRRLNVSRARSDAVFEALTSMAWPPSVLLNRR
jgi:peptidoglycan/xylan/chitin deacetylase (PgdA/CDA1 family)